jgi:nitrate/nitrite transporter NarK
MNLIFSIKQCGVPIGGVLAGLMLPPITLRFGWPVALILCAALVVGLSLAILGRQRAWDTDRERAAPVLSSPLSSVALVWRNKVVRWLALSSFVYAAVQLCLTGFLVTYLVAEVGMDLVQAGTVLAVAHTSGAAGRLIWGWLADRMRSGSMAMIGIGVMCVAGALAIAAVSADWPFALIAAATALFGFSAMGWNGVFIAVVARQLPQSIGVATGGSLAITYAGIVIGPAAFAALHDQLGLSYGTSFALLAPITAIGIACVVQARRHIQA